MTEVYKWDVSKSTALHVESQSSISFQSWTRKFYIAVRLLSTVLTTCLLTVSLLVAQSLTSLMIAQISTKNRVVSYCPINLANKNLEFMVDCAKHERSHLIPYGVNVSEAMGMDQSHIVEIDQILWVWVLIFSFIIPELFTLIKSCLLWLKGIIPDEEDRYWEIFGVVCFFQTCHSIGLALLIFDGLPQLDSIEGIVILNSVGLLPSIFNLLSKGYNSKQIVVDLLAVIAQISGCITWPILSWSSGGSVKKPISLVLGLILTSFGWWETYANQTKKPIQPLKYFSDIRTSLYKEGARVTIDLWSSFIKIVTFFFTSWFLISSSSIISSPENLFSHFKKAFNPHVYHVIGVSNFGIDSSDPIRKAIVETVDIFMKTSYWAPLAILFIQSLASFLSYLLSLFACKVRIQGVSFALSVSIACPILSVILLGFCGAKSQSACFLSSVIPKHIFWDCPAVGDILSYTFTRHLWLWIPWFLSSVWTCIHIWFCRSRKLAHSQDIFCSPFYLSLLIDKSLKYNKRRDGVPETEVINEGSTKIYGCATLWHETKEEMVELLKSIFRIDEDYYWRKRTCMEDQYEWEAHLLFDDAFVSPKKTKSGYPELNSYVKTLVGTIEEAAIAVHKKNIGIPPPVKLATPYGGRLTWRLPGGTHIVCHLKDKQEIRHKKRWSQCMYMYYLLGFQMQDIPEDRLQIVKKNTYILALDGDVDFQPEALLSLIDIMKNGSKIGAVCGRIHPLGTGFMTWYQMFEYAIGHWLQKATEDIIGCVLCSPGCFSLFRAEALMDDNVMRTYTKVSERAQDYVQYDQGEDRWLCTLLLKRGWRVAYSAVSDAYTFVPVDFNEFFKQRRRWMPSTMANIIDILGTYKQLIEENRDISFLYIIYHTMLMVGTILGPGTIFLMIVGSFSAAFKIKNSDAFIYNLIPIIGYMLICFKLKDNTQLFVAQILSALYSLVMMAVMVGIMLQITEDGWLAPSTLSFFLIALSFIFAGIIHPQEIMCLPYGLIYYITIPAMYLLLVIYSIFNLNVVSWGTRDDSKPKEVVKEIPKENGFKGYINEVKGFFIKSNQNDTILEEIKKDVKKLLMQEEPEIKPLIEQEKHPLLSCSSNANIDVDDEIIERNPLINPYWFEDPDLSKASKKMIPYKEKDFWTNLIAKYLKPLDENKDYEEKKARELLSLRNQMVFSFFMLNAIFVVVVYLLQQQKSLIFIAWPFDAKANISFINSETSPTVEVNYDYLQLEPIGFVFIIFFALVLVVQLIGMFFHRLHTIMHVIARSTSSLSTQLASQSVRKMSFVETLITTEANKNKGRRKTHIQFLDDCKDEQYDLESHIVKRIELMNENDIKKVRRQSVNPAFINKMEGIRRNSILPR